MREVDLRLEARLDQDGPWRRKSQGKSRLLLNGRALVVTLVTVLVIFAVRSNPNSSGPTQFDSGPSQFGVGSSRLNATREHIAVVNNKEVKGKRVLVLVDNSGSMIGKDPEPQIAKLAAAGISVTHRVNIPGFAISFTDGYSMLSVLLRVLEADPTVDTVYVISDFAAGDEEANDPVARQQLQRTLSNQQARIYWASVNLDPGAEYYEIARQSGGDVIPNR